MNGKNLKKTLGIAAGGVAGAKVGKDSSEKHPVFGGLAGAFVGMVAGLFSADAVNALTNLGDAAQSRGEVQPQGMLSEIELAIAEGRGTARGFMIIASLMMAVIDVPELWDAIKRSDDITKDEFGDLFQKNQEAFFALLERHLRQNYAAVNARWPLPDHPLGLSYDEDGSLLEALLKRKLAAL